MAGRRVGVLIADGTDFWFVDKGLPSSVQANDWFNLAFRWSVEKGVQVFINGALLDEIPFPRTKVSADLPLDNKLYVGCRKEDNTLTDFTNMEMDELAFWRYYMPDKKIKLFTGAISESRPRSRLAISTILIVSCRPGTVV